MKILFISAVLPYPLYSGGQVRVYNLLRELSKKHKIILLSFIRNEGEREEAKRLDFLERVEVVYRGRAWQPKYVIASLGKYPFLLNTYNNREMREKIAELLRGHKFDGIHIEPFYVWPSLPETDLPIVAGEHNIEYEVYRAYVEQMRVPIVKQLFAYDAGKLKWWEEQVWKKAKHVITVSDDDKEVVKNFNPHVTVVPNGVDTEHFTYNKNLLTKRLNIFFVGSFRWMQNRDAVRELVEKIWPLIKEKYLSAQLNIVGKSADNSLKSLIVLGGGELKEGVGDIREEFKNATLLLAPIKIGGGTSYKILEAMAAGVPVFTSPLGANGLRVENGKHLYICNSPDDYLQAVNKIMTDSDFCDELRCEARKLIEDRYSWANIAKLMDKVWEKAYGR